MVALGSLKSQPAFSEFKVNCNSSVYRNTPECIDENKGKDTVDEKTGLDVVEFMRYCQALEVDPIEGLALLKSE